MRPLPLFLPLSHFHKHTHLTLSWCWQGVDRPAGRRSSHTSLCHSHQMCHPDGPAAFLHNCLNVRSVVRKCLDSGCTSKRNQILVIDLRMFKRQLSEHVELDFPFSVKFKSNHSGSVGVLCLSSAWKVRHQDELSLNAQNTNLVSTELRCLCTGAVINFPIVHRSAAPIPHPWRESH